MPSSGSVAALMLTVLLSHICRRSPTKQQQRHWQHKAMIFKTCCVVHAGTGQAAAGSRAGPPDHAAAAAGRQPWQPAVPWGRSSGLQPCVSIRQSGRFGITGWAWWQPPGAGHIWRKPSIPVRHSFWSGAQQQPPGAGGCLAWAASQTWQLPNAWYCSAGLWQACAQPAGRLCQCTGSSSWGGRLQQQRDRARASSPGGQPWGQRE